MRTEGPDGLRLVQVLELGHGHCVHLADSDVDALVHEDDAVGMNSIYEEILPPALVEREDERRPVLLVVHPDLMICRTEGNIITAGTHNTELPQ